MPQVIDFTSDEFIMDEPVANSKERLFTKALNFEIPKEKIETISSKDGGRSLSYISWSYAWGIFKQLYPDAHYEIVKNPQTNLPYFYDPEAGIMVYTRITANHETHEMWLYVMDNQNQAMRFVPYTYKQWNSKNHAWEDRGVRAATMADVNKTVMRCLVKNMSIFGLGLNIYAGSDLPDFDIAQEPKEEKPRATKKRTTQKDRFAAIKAAINAAPDTNSLVILYNSHAQEVEANPEIKQLFTNRKGELLAPQVA